MTRLADSGHSLWAILAVALAAWQLAACATGWRAERVTYTSCEGKQVTAFVRVEESNAPALDCAKAWLERGGHPLSIPIFLAALPLGCSIRYGDNSEGPVWLAIVMAGPFASVLWEHERGHVMLLNHPPGFMVHTHKDC